MATSTATKWTSNKPPPARARAFIYTPAYESLHYPADCPFQTARIPLTRQRLATLDLLRPDLCREVAPEPAPLPVLKQFHTDRYLTELQRAAAGDLTVEGLHMGLGTPDTPVFPQLLDCGRWACGAQIAAADLILDHQADIVFSPFGGFHHAFAEKAAGFCYLNDLVFACLRLAAAGERVLFLDVDAHHGDGVQEAFFERSDVFTVSLHESGTTLFPWGGFENEIGRGAGTGYNVNIPLPTGTYDDAFLRAFSTLVPPLVRAYRPDVIVLELGMDTLAGDPLTHLRLTNNVHFQLMNWLLELNVPLLVTGGGGYHQENTVRGWALAWRTLCGENDSPELLAGLGGVMMESTEWAGGLQDRELPVTEEQKRAVDPAIDRTIAAVQRHVFPHHPVDLNTQWKPEVI